MLRSIGEAPRVAQAVGEDRDGAGGRVDPQELAEAVVVVDAVGHRRRGGRDGLRVAAGIAAAAAVAGAGVEQAVGPELQLAAVVVGLLVVRDRHQRPHVCGVRVVGVGRVDAMLLDGDLPHRALRRVVDVEQAARRVVEREGHREQTALVVRRVHLARDVQEGRPHGAVEHLDGAALLDHEDARGVAQRSGDVDGRREVADLGQRHRRGVRRHRHEHEDGDGQDERAAHGGHDARRTGRPRPHAAAVRLARRARRSARARASAAGRPTASRPS